VAGAEMADTEMAEADVTGNCNGITTWTHCLKYHKNITIFI